METGWTNARTRTGEIFLLGLSLSLPASISLPFSLLLSFSLSILVSLHISQGLSGHVYGLLVCVVRLWFVGVCYGICCLLWYVTRFAVCRCMSWGLLLVAEVARLTDKLSCQYLLWTNKSLIFEIKNSWCCFNLILTWISKTELASWEIGMWHKLTNSSFFFR